MRILTVGPVPPEWGGPNSGGVATFHRMLLERLDGHEVAAITVGDPPVEVLRPPETGEQRWYAQVATGFDVVLMLHVAHRWAVYHDRERPCPAVGAVRSWTPVLTKPSRHERVQQALDAMDVLVLTSQFAVQQGRELGFSYRVEPVVVHNALSDPFRSPVDLDRARSGVIFVGNVSEIKRLAVARHAADVAGVPLTIIEGQPPDVVRDAMLSARALCVPSSSESFGNVYIEAAACGTPSVGYPPAIAELSLAAGTPIGIAPWGDDVAGALGAALEQSWDRDAMRRGVMAAFDPDVMASYYASLLRTCVDG